MAAILVTSLSIGLIVGFAQQAEEERSAAERMQLLCENSCYAIDDYLSSIEQSVDLVTRYAMERLDDSTLMMCGASGLTGWGPTAAQRGRHPSRQQKLDDYLQGYLAEIETVFHSVARHTNGVVAYYFRINPEVSDTASGFFYADNRQQGLEKVPLTVIEDFDPEDENHVGWYYIPLRRGLATWVDPYDNENIDMRMVSYVTPLFRAGSFLGVIGMDVSYDTLISQIEHIRIYDSGYVFLLDNDGRIVYHPQLEYGISLAEHDPDVAGVVDVICNQKRSDSLIRYQAYGTAKYLYFDTLGNDLKLVVCVPSAEVNAGWMHVTRLLLWASVGSLLLFTLAAVLIVNHMIRPLRSLTSASRSIASGDYEVEYLPSPETGKRFKKG